MADININMGLISMVFKNADIWTNLANEDRIREAVNDINKNIGREISVLFDTVYGQGGGSSYYDVKEGEYSVVIKKPTQPESQQWWFNPREGQNMDIFYIISADSDLRIQAGDRLSGRFNSGAIPINQLGNEMWWLSKNKAMTPITDTENMGKNELQKIVDNVVANSYRSLIPRVALGD